MSQHRRLTVSRPDGLVVLVIYDDGTGCPEVDLSSTAMIEDAHRWTTAGLVEIHEGQVRHTPPDDPEFLARLADYVVRHGMDVSISLARPSFVVKP